MTKVVVVVVEQRKRLIFGLGIPSCPRPFPSPLSISHCCPM